LLAGVILLSSCASPAPTSVPAATDEEFKAAVEKAHDTLPIVRRALLSPEPSYVFIGLKIRVYGDAAFEDIWTEPLDYYNGAFTIQMVEGVTVTQGYHPEQFVRVPVEEVIDWMIMEEDGSLIGGYTIRLAYKYMTPEEQEEFIRITGYRVESLLAKD
jgi:uncharacterized protein YegJ (DUF2314 family)